MKTVEELNLRVSVNAVVVLMLLNILVALWFPPFFLTLSNLLFLEGGSAFSIGAFIAFASSSSRFALSVHRENSWRTVRTGLYLMIIGGVLVMLSVAVGSFTVTG
ncbi:MAG: hypothetical protein J7K49_03815 [Thaumarchaeota archaeon]|nr:hypothetical protein [Nitrososphaerota archaeon]